MRTLKARLTEFFFLPASSLPLVVLRVGVAATLLLQAMYLMSHLEEFYGSAALLRKPSLTGWGELGLNTSSWLHLGSRIGLSETASLFGLGGIYVVALLGLLTGVGPHLSALIACLLHLILMDDQVTIYGTDFLAHSALFFLIFLPSKRTISWQSRLGIRAFQLYLCIVYLASGLEKAVGPQWWNGEAIWRSLMLPSLAQVDMSWLSRFPVVPKLLGWGTLLIEIGYAFFIWPPRTRAIWVGLVVALHAGIAFFLGLWLFSLLMIVFTVSVFAVPANLQKIALTRRFVVVQGLRRAA